MYVYAYLELWIPSRRKEEGFNRPSSFFLSMVPLAPNEKEVVDRNYL